MRVMGLDYGSKTMGVAISDELMMIATGLEIIRRELSDLLRLEYQNRRWMEMCCVWCPGFWQAEKIL